MKHTNLIDFFTQDHRSCDQAWIAVENAADSSDATAIAECYGKFQADMLHHFQMEEEVLFPAFEQATGMTQGPTVVMRMEHEQMRGLLVQMAGAAASGDGDELTDLGDTLMMVIQQHNAKEEGMLYPMADQHIPEDWASLQARLEAI